MFVNLETLYTSPQFRGEPQFFTKKHEIAFVVAPFGLEFIIIAVPVYASQEMTSATAQSAHFSVKRGPLSYLSAADSEV